MRSFHPKINSTFHHLLGIQIFITLLFIMNAGVRYVLLMGIQGTIDSLTTGDISITESYLKFCGVLVLIFFLLNCIFQYFYRNLQYTSHYSLIEKLFGLCLRKNCTFHESCAPSAALTMIKDDSKFISDWKSTGGITVVINICSLIMAFGVMLYYNITITAVVFLIILGCFLCTRCISRAISDRTYKLQVSNTEISRQITEALGGVKDIKQYRKEEFFENRLSDFIRTNPYEYSRSISRYYSAFTSTYAMLVIALPIITVLFGVHMILRGQLTIGQLIAIYGAAGTLQEPVQVIPEYLNKRTQALAMEEKIAPILANAACSYKAEKQEAMKEFHFHSAGYTFSDQKQILKDVDFTILPGDVCILKGPSGRGKTSLLNLISRYISAEGQPVTITYNGIPVEMFLPEAYYNHVIQAQQFPCMFKDTIQNNITLGEAYSEEALKEVIHTAGLDEFVRMKGMSYMLEAGGDNISGGQKQRLGLARALIRRPDLLLLDEPVSALNPELAELVTKQVLSYSRKWKITLILISHNDSFERYLKGDDQTKMIFI